jgi:hypothetical protein
VKKNDSSNLENRNLNFSRITTLVQLVFPLWRDLLTNTLNFDELSEELNLQLERLSLQSELNSESKENEEYALFTSQFKGKYRNCGQVGHKTI